MSNSIRFSTNHLPIENGRTAQPGYAPQPGFGSTPHSVSVVGAPVSANIVRMPVGAIRRASWQ